MKKRTDHVETLREDIIQFYKDIYPESYRMSDLMYLRDIKGTKEVNEFVETIYELIRKGVLEERKEALRWHGVDDEFEGIYKGYRNNYGFLVNSNAEEDIFISEEGRNGAMHNDKVRVKLVRQGTAAKRREGIVVEIIERTNTTIVGTFDLQGKFGFVTPDDERLGEDIFVMLEDSMEARTGAKVEVTITKWPNFQKKAEGYISRVLGYEGDKGVDIDCILAKHHIPFAFPERVIQESERLDLTIGEDPDRLDVRDWDTITIDGEDAKDLDDAVSIRPLANGGYQLGVHIADVSHYVKTGSAIDAEAYQRGTSVYVVDRVIPMLPEILSNQVCSLQAGEDRYAMSCIMEVDKHGRVVSHTIAPSLIHVNRRCSYGEIYKMITQGIVPSSLEPFREMIQHLESLAQILRKARERRGALDFDFPEYKILLNEEGKPVRIVKRERTIAERIIEECMLLANETVARHLRDAGDPTVYRIHEQPIAEKVQALQKVLNYLGANLRLDEEEVTPKDLQAVLAAVEGTDIEQVAQVMILRAMKQAKYSVVNAGHYGLASPCYTHFTSPIRRYPDLLVHRLLKRDLHWKSGYVERDADESYLITAAQHSSEQEQNAVEAERETDNLKKVEYMEPYVGEVFEGYISSITGFGMFVELPNGIDGLVHISMLNDDYYHFDEEHYVLVGMHTGQQFRLGDPVKVTLIKADKATQQIDFALGEVDINELASRMPFRGRRMLARKPKETAPKGRGKKAKKERTKKKSKDFGKKRRKKGRK